MRFRSVLFLAFIGLASLAPVPAATIGAQGQAAAESPTQTVAIRDTRTGSSPCGFPVRRDIAGTVELVPQIDAAGNLVLSIGFVTLSGNLTNPANGKSVDLPSVEQNGIATFRADGSTTSVALALSGRFFRGYDTARTDLAMDLPADGAEVIEFEPGARSEEPWPHVCGQLA